MESYVINDANIFFDIINLGLIDAFFRLPYKFSTINYVLREVKNVEQYEVLQRYIENGMKIYEVDEVFKLIGANPQLRNQLSVTDKLVILHTKTFEKAMLLTGDMRMRRDAESEGIIVKGILFVFDELVRNGIITDVIACEKLNELMQTNPRLSRSKL